MRAIVEGLGLIFAVVIAISVATGFGHAVRSANESLAQSFQEPR